jgi:hypothetical protein
MTIWQRYNLFFFGFPLLSFLVFFIVAQLGSVIIGLIIMGCGLLLMFILSCRIVCPNCKTPLYSSNDIRSKYYKASIVIPEKCVNCGYDLNGGSELITQWENIQPKKGTNPDKVRIQNSVIQTYKLGDLVNSSRLSALIYSNKNNPEYVDYALAAGIRSMSQAQMDRFIGNMIVYAVSDWLDVLNMIDTLEMPTPHPDVTMVTVGKYIYVRNTEDLSMVTDDTANLLGHEVIHGLQIVGIGDASFFCSYRSTSNDNNVFEGAAYNWGGDSVYATKPQILPANPGWWR